MVIVTLKEEEEKKNDGSIKGDNVRRSELCHHFYFLLNAFSFGCRNVVMCDIQLLNCNLLASVLSNENLPKSIVNLAQKGIENEEYAPLPIVFPSWISSKERKLEGELSARKGSKK